MHTAKYAAKNSKAKAMINHYWKNWERTKDPELIDHTKNKDNYQITMHGTRNEEIVKNSIDVAIAEHNRVSAEIPRARKLRSDAPVLADIIITATPEMLDTFEHRKELPEFFKQSYKYFAEDLQKRGLNLEKSKLTGFVHMNESTPQMHLCFMPVMDDGRISFKKIIKRDFYQNYHENLSKHLERALGRKLSILIEDDKDINRMLARAGVDQKTYKKIKDVVRANLVNECGDLAKQKECLRQDITSLEEECRKAENELETGHGDSVREPTAEEWAAEQDRKFERRAAEITSDIGTLQGQIDKLKQQCNEAGDRERDLSEEIEKSENSVRKLQQQLDDRTADRDSSFEWERERLQSAVDRIRATIERQFEQASGLLESVVEYCKDNCKGLFIGASKRKQAWESGMRACKTPFVRDSNIKWGNELDKRIRAVKREITASDNRSRSGDDRNKIASSISLPTFSRDSGRGHRSGGIDDR